MTGKSEAEVKKIVGQLTAEQKKDNDIKAQKVKVNASKPTETITADQVKNEVEKKVADTNKGTQNGNLNITVDLKTDEITDNIGRELIKDQKIIVSWLSKSSLDYTTTSVAKGR